MGKTSIAITGMTCGHCVAGVNRALRALDGVQVHDVRVGSAEVTFDSNAVSSDKIVEAIKDEGYVAEISPAQR